MTRAFGKKLKHVAVHWWMSKLNDSSGKVKTFLKSKTEKAKTLHVDMSTKF